MTELHPYRCDMCGGLGHREEDTLYTLELKGLSSWVREAPMEWDVCNSCREALLAFIDKRRKEVTED